MTVPDLNLNLDIFPSEKLSVSDIEPLVGALDDPSLDVRVAALRGLVRLPLDAGARKRVGDRLVVKIEDICTGTSPPDSEVLEIVDAAAFVPHNAVRQHLRELASVTTDTTRNAALISLAKAGDHALFDRLLGDEPVSPDDWPPAVWELLPRAAPADPETRRRLAAVFESLGPARDAGSDSRADVYARADVNNRRFWTALALARSGLTEPLETVLRDIVRDQDSFPMFWGDPSVLAQKLDDAGGLSREARERLREIVPADAAPPLDVLARAFAEPSPRIETGVTPPVQRPPQSPEAVRRAREVLDQLRTDGVFVTVDDPEPLDVTGGSAYIAKLLEDACKSPRQDLVFPVIGNAVVEIADTMGWGLRGDTPGVLPTFRRLRQAGVSTEQIGWLVGREGMRAAVEQLSPQLTGDDEDRESAASLIEAAASAAARRSAPIVGGGTASSGLPPLARMDDAPPAAPPDSGGEPPVGAVAAAADTSVSPRYLNAGFFKAGHDREMAATEPLSLAVGQYRVGVDVGSFWGPGVPGPDMNTLLSGEFKDRDAIELDVVVYSFTVATAPSQATLRLPRVGNSERIFFEATLRESGRQTLGVHLLYRGHLLQARRLDFFVVGQGEHAQPDPALPAQDGYVTFVRTVELDQSVLEPLRDKPSKLTIVPSLETMNVIGLHFYDSADQKLRVQSTQITQVNLGPMLDAARGQLVRMMHAYAGGIGGDEDVLRRHLGQLASIGRSLYREILPAAPAADTGGGRRDGGMALSAGGVVQVAPLSGQLSVPWEILYERKFGTYREDETKLCPTFKEHGPDPDGCPGRDDPTVVCPHGFWGYRYIVEQLPGRLDPREPLPRRELVWKIWNTAPLRLNAAVHSKLTRLTTHWDTLRGMATEQQLSLVRLDSLATLKAALARVDADILYFYSHGGKDAFGRPYLEIGDGVQVGLNDFDAWSVSFFDRPPLIVMNACDSAEYSPADFENMIKFFCDHGAAGVIGPQCEVKEWLAGNLAHGFFRRFFGQTPAGPALFAARRDLLYDDLDPRGLAYSLFAPAEIRLDHPVELIQ